MLIFSPLYGAVAGVTKELKSTWFGFAGSVALKKSASVAKVVPPKPVGLYGRKNTPCRKMLNELKNEKRSKLAPKVTTCRPTK